MNGSITDWPRLFEQGFKYVAWLATITCRVHQHLLTQNRSCKPGGWIECQEIAVDARTDDNSLPEGSYIRQWCANQEAAAQKAGLTLQISGDLLEKQMKEAGFENTVVHESKIPVGPWPADSRLSEVGSFQIVAMLEGIHGLTIALWTRFLGWSALEVEIFLDMVRTEFRSKEIHCYWPLYVVSLSSRPWLTAHSLDAIDTSYTDRSR